MNRSDEGSGTMAGVALVMLAAVLLATIAAAGHLLICRSRARTAADLAALSAAVALWDGRADSCAVAGRTAAAHEGRLVSCDIGGESGSDVTVRVSVATQVPFMPRIVLAARAGPVACE
ncbi:Rv3654c family TadE-like protein [Bifidobacterium platyrrhinorum]|uniref:Pilus assembly protein TadE n=1 Tax=Bifidobacterium platyrrhinorum TaxID=2661628 RepID=A0A6L9SS06_9BIFI|nr:Rv3654c family TadE-like protein [Bifidobacterium platyrrhinorum]NEG55336.1 pilus assembly protein TadE [Bifidobacterium platyrrhinorum]